jgi:hypothetical protein
MKLERNLMLIKWKEFKTKIEKTKQKTKRITLVYR